MLDTSGSSKKLTAPSRTKAEPIGGVCHTSVKMYLRKGRKCQRQVGENRKGEEQQGEHPGERNRRCSMVVELAVACGGATAEQVCPEGTANCE